MSEQSESGKKKMEWWVWLLAGVVLLVIASLITQASPMFAMFLFLVGIVSVLNSIVTLVMRLAKH